MKYKEIELLSIGAVRVYRPPTMKIHRMVSAKYHYPKQPTMQIPIVTPKGQPQQYETLLLVEGPEFDAWKGECDALDERRHAEIGEMNVYFALKDVTVPDDFDVDQDFGELARAIDEHWKPRDGKMGRKLDYIEWVVCGVWDDNNAVSDTISQLIGISQEVVDDVKDTFQRDMAGDGDQAVEGTVAENGAQAGTDD